MAALEELSNPALKCEDSGPSNSMIPLYAHHTFRPDEYTVALDRDLLAIPRTGYLKDAPDKEAFYTEQVTRIWFDASLL